MAESSLVPQEFQEFNGSTPYTIDLDSDESELWLIRVPENVTAEQLKNIKMRVPKTEEEDEKKEPKALGKIADEAGNTYSLYQVPDNVDNGIGGQEMAGLTVMLPKDGKLSFASKDVKRCLVLDEEIEVPDSVEAAKAVLAKPVLPRPQPEGLKMRFKPYGFDTGAPAATKKSSKKDGSKESKKRKREEGKEKKKKSKKSSA